MYKRQQLDRYTSLRHPVGETVLKFTAQQTRQMLSRNALSNLLLRAIMPVVMKLPFVHRKALVTMTGLDTPQPEWL